jgi:hypothetical protein
MQLYCDEFVFPPVAFRTPRTTNWYFRIFWLLSIVSGIAFIHSCCRVRLKCVGTWGRTGGEVEGKLANGVGSQYPSHYIGTWCIQRYYRDAHTSAELTPPPI